MEVHEYLAHDAVGLADLVRTGEVTSGEVQACAVARHEATDADIHAVLEWYGDPLPVADTAGALAGVPFLRKDYGSTEAGRLVEMGSRLAAGNRADRTTVFFERLRAAGTVIVGRSAVPEFIQHGSTESDVFGATRNPHRLDLSSGGSSGGSASAVAAGVVPAASASDCAGSIRIPAATCGLVGLKPGRRRVPWESGGWGGIAEEFVVARSVRDARLFLDVLGSGPYAQLQKPARLGLSVDHWAGFAPDPEVVAATEACAVVLEAAGHVVEMILRPFDIDELRSTWHGLFTRWVAADVEHLVASTGRPANDTTLEPLTLAALDAVRELTVSDITEAQLTQGRITRQLDESLDGIDVIVTPTLGRVEIPLGTIAGRVESVERYLDLGDALFPYSYGFNVAGWPSLSVPAAVSASGVPIGVQLSARPGHEHTLLDLAGVLELASPWPTEPPSSSHKAS